MLALYGNTGGDYSWLIWVVAGLVVLLAITAIAWWRTRRRRMSSRMSRARGKMNRAIGRTQGRIG
jgi:LPXTG-motif cell wall-anchored protein